MKIKVPVWAIILAVIILLGGVYYLGGIKSRQEKDRLSTALKMAHRAYNDTLITRELTIDGLRHQVATKDAIILSQREAVKAGYLDKQELKRLNAGLLRTNTKLTLQVKALQDSLPLSGNTVVYDTVRDFNAIKVPAHFSYADRYLKLSVDIFADSWKFDKMDIVPVTATVGDKVVLTTPNPRVKFTDVQTIVVPQKTKFFNSKVWRWTERAGIAAGFFWLGRQ